MRRFQSLENTDPSFRPNDQADDFSRVCDDLIPAPVAQHNHEPKLSAWVSDGLSLLDVHAANAQRNDGVNHGAFTIYRTDASFHAGLPPTATLDDVALGRWWAGEYWLWGPRPILFGTILRSLSPGRGFHKGPDQRRPQLFELIVDSASPKSDFLQ